MDPRLLEGSRACIQLVLLVVVAYLVTRIAWLILAPAGSVSTMTPRPLPTPVGQSSVPELRADVSLLMKKNPFEAGEAGAPAVEDAPETDLNLKLVALFMSTGDGATSSATIITPDNKAIRYEPGEEILPGVTLERVLSDRAIITREGREETIMRSGREAGLTVIGDTSAVRDEAGRVTTERPPVFEPGISAMTFMAGIEAEPQMQNETVRALVLRPRGDGSLMRSAGLEPGDRIVKVNGKAVADIDVSSMASQLGAGGTTIVDIVRSGEDRAIEIRFEKE